ncbi:MAG: hypothetical protein IJR59_06485 [Firmicutes bacterium]|nr:hypothetical protein [Bacillota bacterium]
MKEKIKYKLKSFGFGLFLLSLCALFAFAAAEPFGALFLGVTVYLPIVLTVINMGNSIFGTRKFEPLLMFGVALGGIEYVLISDPTHAYSLNDKTASLQFAPQYVIILLIMAFTVFWLSLFIVGFLYKKAGRTLVLIAAVLVAAANILNLGGLAIWTVMWIKERFFVIYLLPVMYNIDILVLSARYLKGAFLEDRDKM